MKTIRVLFAVGLLGILLSATAQNKEEKQIKNDRNREAAARSQNDGETGYYDVCCDWDGDGRHYVRHRHESRREAYRRHHHGRRHGCGSYDRDEYACCDDGAGYDRRGYGRGGHHRHYRYDYDRDSSGRRDSRAFSRARAERENS